MKKGLLLLGTLVLILTLMPVAVDASHAWGNYHWARASNPVSLAVGDNTSGPWGAHLATAVNDWNQSLALNLSVVGGQAKGRCMANEGRIEVCNDAYGATGWLGIAQIWTSGDHITQAVAKMNDTYFSSAPYNTAAWRQMVMCQEIGHDFGLGHQDENFDDPPMGTCMDYTRDPVPNQHPDGHDYDQLSLMYAHFDGGGSGGGSDCNPRSPKCNGSGNNGIGNSELSAPGEWGQLVRQQGRVAIYERDFGNGNRVFTFVTWAN